MIARTGRCLCGQVRYRLNADPVVARICWCRDCQRIAANGTANAVFPSAALEVHGSLNAYTSTADSGNQVSRRFCPQCGCHLFADSTGRPQLTVVRTGTLDDPSSIRPTANIWSTSAPAWACLDAALERLDHQPPPLKPPGQAAAGPVAPAGPADGVFVSDRLLPFTVAQVHAAFAQADQLAAWWGPEGFRNSFEVFEFWPQGRWTLVMHGPDGQSYPNKNLFLETSAQRIVVRHAVAPLFTLTVTLADRGGQTHLHWHQAFDDARVAASVAHIVGPANEQNLDRLHSTLQAAA